MTGDTVKRAYKVVDVFTDKPLLGNPVADPERPLEVLRTVHSFDPCLACAVHLTDVETKTVVQVKAL